MQRYIDIVRDDSGNAVDSATVYVYEGDSMTLATLYDGNDVAVSQPLSTDTDGVIINESTDSSHKLGFKVAGGRYRIEASKSGQSFTLPDLLIGTMSGQDTDNVVITGGSISGIIDLALADGGTGASTAAGARTNLEVEAETRTAPQATTHDFTTDADYTLTSAQEEYGRIILTDTTPNLTTGRNVIVSTTEQRYIISNETAQTLTVKTSAGTGVAVPADKDRTVYCDGTDVIELDDTQTAALIDPAHWPTIANGTDTDHDIDISAGTITDSTGVYSLTASALTKQIDATWAAGDAAGGLFSGTVATDTTYHVFLIRKDSDASIDAGFDTSVSAANIPSGYTAYRRIGSVVTDASSNILAFTQIGDHFILGSWVQDASTTVGTTASLVTLSVPSGISVDADLVITAQATNAGAILITSPYVADAAVSTTYSTSPSHTSTSNANREALMVRTNTSGQVRIRASDAAQDYALYTFGWRDSRGID